MNVRDMVRTHNPLDENECFKDLETPLVGRANVPLFQDINHAFANQDTVNFIFSRYSVQCDDQLHVSIAIGGNERILINPDDFEDEINKTYRGLWGKVGAVKNDVCTKACLPGEYVVGLINAFGDNHIFRGFFSSKPGFTFPAYKNMRKRFIANYSQEGG
jgi:hypothetical protein